MLNAFYSTMPYYDNSPSKKEYRKVSQFHYISDVTFSFVSLTPPFCRELLLPSSRDKTLRSCHLLLCVDILIQLNNLYLSNYVIEPHHFRRGQECLYPL